MPNKTLPILLKNQKVLIVGGGKVALHKAKVLSDNEISFRIVAQKLTNEIMHLCDEIEKKDFELSDIRDEKIIIDATGNIKVSMSLLKYKEASPILLNVVDIPEYCDFYFMALTKNRPLQIAVSSNGASPTAAKFFRDECENLIPKDITKYLKSKQKERNEGIIEVDKTLTELESQQMKVYLVGCGIGDPELLTMKAYKVIQDADVVLYDHLISEEIMALVPETTKKIFVGKQQGYHSKSQEEINALLIRSSREYKKVARLKSGDPFVFGRGAEELEALSQLKIQTEVIPGVSSSIAGPMMADIPVTARGYASGFTVVSAHLKGNSLNVDWVSLLLQENHTVVVLMGLSKVNEIIQRAKHLGVSDTKPCAIISNASRSTQKTVVGTLESLSQDAVGMQRPAIIVFGEVVNYSKECIGVYDGKVTASV